jgi:hypothetical protein
VVLKLKEATDEIALTLVPYFWSTYSGAELDLFMSNYEQKIGIEFKFIETPTATKSMHIALSDLELEKIYE